MSAALPKTDALLMQQRNLRLARKLGLAALLMVGFGFAMVPMYDAFCAWTGLNGRPNTQAVAYDGNTQVDLTRKVTVEFLSHTLPGTGLSFKAEHFSQAVHPGAIETVNYVVTNHSTRTFVGQAVPSITPAQAAPSFEKLQCFCFSQQTFAPGETRTLPVVFVVKPSLDSDVHTLTLSYTFFEAPNKPNT